MRIAGAMALLVVAATLVAGWRILRRAERRQAEIERLTESGLTMTEEPPLRPRETATPAPPDPAALAEQEARRVAAEREGRARAMGRGRRKTASARAAGRSACGDRTALRSPWRA